MAGTGDFSGHHIVVIALGPTQRIQCGYRGSVPGVKRPEREVKYSPQSTAKVKNKWRYTSTLPICFHSMDIDILPLFTIFSLFVVCLMMLTAAEVL